MKEKRFQSKSKKVTFKIKKMNKQIIKKIMIMKIRNKYRQRSPCRCIKSELKIMNWDSIQTSSSK